MNIQICLNILGIFVRIIYSYNLLIKIYLYFWCSLIPMLKLNSRCSIKVIASITMLNFLARFIYCRGSIVFTNSRNMFLYAVHPNVKNLVT